MSPTPKGLRTKDSVIVLQSVAQFYSIHFHRSLDLTFAIARARIFNPLLKHLIYNSYVLIHIAYLGYEKSNIKVVCSEIILYLCGETEEDIHDFASMP